MNEPTTCVVLPAHNAAEHLHFQLGALTRQVPARPLTVVVSDNGSTDDTAAVARAWEDRFERLVVVDASARRGPAFARNVGAASSTEDLILFCDADDVATPSWVDGLVRTLDSHDVVGGPYDVFLLNSREVASWVPEYGDEGPPHALRYLPYAYGGNLGVRRAAFESVGGFDVGYLGHEEVEFCWRLQESGFSLGWSESAVMNYRLRTSVRQLGRAKYRSGLTGTQLRAAHDRAGMAPFTMRRQLRVLQDHLRAASDLRTSPARERWLLGSAWVWGCVVGQCRYGRALRKRRIDA